MIFPLAGLLPAPFVQSIFRFMLPPLPDLPPDSRPRAETPAPAGKTFQLSQQYCSFCQRTVLHSVLEKVDSREHTTSGAESWLLQCKGCGAFSLQ